MTDSSDFDLIEIIDAIRGLSPTQQRLLQRRLRTSGILLNEESVTDRDRLSVAPALSGAVRKTPAWANREVIARQENVDTHNIQDGLQILQPAEPVVEPSGESIEELTYESPVRGKVVVGSPNDKEVDDPHGMSALPGQAPEQPIGILFDGGSKGNPGQGYGSYALHWPGLPQQIVQLRFGEQVTNNEAEYDTLIAALEATLTRLHDSGASPKSARLDIRGDSQLVVNQIVGEWQCKEPRMLMRRDRARELLSRFGSWRLLHHNREHSVRTLGH